MQPVVVWPGVDEVYAAGAGMPAAGVIGAGDMPFEATFAKLHPLFAIGYLPEAMRREFLCDLSGEISA